LLVAGCDFTAGEGVVQMPKPARTALNKSPERTVEFIVEKAGDFAED
jgi:hypothetical protein